METFSPKEGAVHSFRETLMSGVEIIRQGKLNFYVVRAGESLATIKEKLEHIPEFSYLKRAEYDLPKTSTARNIQGFNTPTTSLTPGFRLVIPMDSRERKISNRNFMMSCHNAINDILKSNTEITHNKVKYNLKNQLSQWLHDSKWNVQKLIAFMSAFARSETANIHDASNFKNNKLDPIGTVECHRWEAGSYGCYSFSYYHILMNRPSTGGSEGFSARIGLGLEEGDTYEPKNAAKLFLAYRIMKTGGNPEIYDPSNNASMMSAATRFNGGIKGYKEKFLRNFRHFEHMSLGGASSAIPISDTTTQVGSSYEKKSLSRKEEQLSEANLLISKKIFAEIKKKNTNCSASLKTSKHTDTMHIQMHPNYDSSVTYDLMLDSNSTNWIIKDASGFSIEFNKKISVGIESIVQMIFTILDRSFAHRPDDIEDGVCTYQDQQIWLNKNWSFRDEIVADKINLKPILDSFPTRSDEVAQKIITLINNIYKNPGK